jgi:hypothetical protein
MKQKFQKHTSYSIKTNNTRLNAHILTYNPEKESAFKRKCK